VRRNWWRIDSVNCHKSPSLIPFILGVFDDVGAEEKRAIEGRWPNSERSWERRRRGHWNGPSATPVALRGDATAKRRFAPREKKAQTASRQTKKATSLRGARRHSLNAETLLIGWIEYANIVNASTLRMTRGAEGLQYSDLRLCLLVHFTRNSNQRVTEILRTGMGLPQPISFYRVVSFKYESPGNMWLKFIVKPQYFDPSNEKSIKRKGMFQKSIKWKSTFRKPINCNV